MSVRVGYFRASDCGHGPTEAAADGIVGHILVYHSTQRTTETQLLTFTNEDKRDGAKDHPIDVLRKAVLYAFPTAMEWRMAGSDIPTAAKKRLVLQAIALAKRQKLCR